VEQMDDCGRNRKSQRDIITYLDKHGVSAMSAERIECLRI
jgi:hypothetical protein